MTEVFSPARVNELAAKFGLVPGASHNLTSGWDFSFFEDPNRAWKLIKTSVPLVVIGSPRARYSVICRNLMNMYIATIRNG